MQFVTNGPDVPEALLRAQEEGRLVFFCGAGISYNVGYKDFKWLVERIYNLSGATRTPTENNAYEKQSFDTTLNILEHRLPGRRKGQLMRKALTKALRPKRLRQGAMDTHAALLDLAMTREGVLRLVTTNFDRTFQRVAWQDRRRFDVFSAPMLPVPKPSQWNGLVYLHGLIPSKEADARALDRLVVTSGDFGLAYLTERWAARFVNELFLNYVVCFVGYSINDPVLRYMMDALAADRLRGEAGEVAYAMDAYDQDEKDATIADWKAKGVTPVLYNRTGDHAHLHSTLKVWAEDYRNGIRGKERIVVEHGISNPSASTKQEDFVGRMLWALSDKTGAPARRFAELEPVPSLDWLKALSNDRYRHEDLLQFDVPPPP